MDRKTQLHQYLEEIQVGKISEANISFLRSYSKDKSEWLTASYKVDLFKICEAIQKFIGELSAGQLKLQVMLLVLESHSIKKNANTTLLIKHSMPSICKYLENAFGLIGTKMKKRDKSALSKILSLLTNLELPFELYPKKLLYQMFHIVFNEVTNVAEYCLLFLLSLPKTDAVSWFIVEAIFDIVEKKTLKFRKPYSAMEKKVSMPFLFLIAYTQGILGGHDADSYEKCFRFTAHFAENLCNKCGNTQHGKSFMAFAEDYLTSLITLGDDPAWPAVPFILQLLTKNIFCKILGPKTCYKLQSFLIKQIPRIAERLKGCESIKSNFSIPRLQMIITAYVQKFPKDYTKGNVLQAYHNMWLKNFPDSSIDSEMDEQCDEKDAQRAAIILAQSTMGHATSVDCLKLLLKCSDNSNKFVKTNAIKALGKVILLEPAYLSIAKVQFVLGDCLETLTADGRLSICNMFGTYLSTEPSLTDKFIHYFITLLNDDAVTVRRAAVKAIGQISSVDYFLGMETVTTKILLLFYDPELEETVLEFFRNIFVVRVNHLGCLVEINVNANIRKIMVPILKKLNNSQADELKVELSILAEAVVLYLTTNTEEKKKLAAAVILEALAQVHPSCLSGQLSNIFKLTFNDLKEPYLKKKMCRVLIATADFIKDEEKCQMYNCVKKIITENFLWDQLGPCVSELLMVLEKFANENIFDYLIGPSLHILLSLREEEYYKQDIFLPLSIIALLWRDLERSEEIINLLIDFLKKPFTQVVVLSAMAEARLRFISNEGNPVLNRLICKFIQDKKNTNLAITALKYLNNSIIGDEANYERPEMKKLGDSTTASLSLLLQETLPAVLTCAIYPQLGIRRMACGVIRLVVQSGLLLRSHFISHLIGMTADDCVEIGNTALDALKGMPEADVSLFAINGVEKAYQLLKALHPHSIVRGVVKETGNSACHKSFNLIHSVAKIRKILENLITDATKKDKIEEVVFFLDNAVFYPFKTYNEVFYLIETLENAIFQFRQSFHGRILTMAKDCLAKAYKFSPMKKNTKIQRVSFTDYLETEFYSNWEQAGEDSAMAFLIATNEDSDSETEPQDNAENLKNDDVDVKSKKRTRTASYGKKRKQSKTPSKTTQSPNNNNNTAAVNLTLSENTNVF